MTKTKIVTLKDGRTVRRRPLRLSPSALAIREARLAPARKLRAEALRQRHLAQLRITMMLGVLHGEFRMTTGPGGVVYYALPREEPERALW